MSQSDRYQLASSADFDPHAFDGVPDPDVTSPAAIRAWHLATTPRGHSAPYRTEPRTASKEVVDALNEAEGNEHARRYEPAEAARERIQNQVNANRARIRSWTRHPDETVVLELLSKLRWVSKNGRTQRTFVETERDLVIQEVARRALVDAEHEGAVWTPVIDYLLIRNSSWSLRHVWDGPGTEEEQFAKLQPWIETQTDPRALEPLLCFGSSQLIRFILESAPVVDQRLVYVVWKMHPSKLYVLVRNRNLPDPVARNLVSRFTDVLTRVDQLSVAADVPSATRVLRALTEIGHDLPDEFRESALNALRRVAKERDGELTHVATQVLHFLHQVDGMLDEDDLLRIWGWLDPDEEASNVQSLIRHPAAGARLWTDILSETGHFKLRQTVLRHERARRNKEVRELLAETTSGTLLASLCRASRGAELRDHFRRLSRHDPVRALDLFDDEELPRVEDLDAPKAFRYLVERLSKEEPEQAIRHMEEATEESPWTKHLTPRSTWWGVLFDGLIAADPPKARQMLQRGRKNWLYELPYDRQEALRKVLRAYCDTAPEEVIRRLERKEDWWVAVAGDEADRIPYLRRAYRVLCDQGNDERQTADQMLTVWRQAPGGTRGWMAHLDAEDFEGQIRHGDPGHLDTLIRMRPDLVNDDAGRSLLLERAKQGITDILLKAGLEANPTAFRELFSAAAELNVRYAVWMLEDEGMAEGRKGLTPEDLVPLLSSEDSEVRATAMLATSEIGGKPEPEASEPPRGHSGPTR